MGIGSVCPCERSVRAVTGAFGDACPGLPCPDLAWYAIYTQTSRERMARDQIRQLDIEAFLPSYTRLSRWGVRGDVVKVEAPLFPGYMFARFDAASDLGVVKRAGGVSQVIGPGSRPLRVGDEIVETLRRATQNSSLVSPVPYVPFREGERVTVARGPFAGLSGVVDRRTKSRTRIVVSIEILQRACAVEVAAEELLRAS